MKSFRNIGPEWVHTGQGSLTTLNEAIARLGGERVLVLSTQSLRSEASKLETMLSDRHLRTYSDCKQHSPSGTVTEAAIAGAGADTIVSFGGGSVIDTAKAVAAQLGHLPQVAIPTTLSAGEFTPGVGITDEGRRAKDVTVDLRAIPRVVIHDPEVTRTTPQTLWLSTGIKALDHAVEALWWQDTHPKNALTAADAASRLLTWLPQSKGANAANAREQCFLGAWMAIQTLFATGARLSHPVGHQLGAFWNIPHGITSCIALPTSLRALDEVTPLVRDQIAPLFGASDGNAAAEALEKLLDDLELPHRLRDTEAKEAEIPLVAEAIEHEFAAMKREPEVDLLELLKSMW